MLCGLDGSPLGYSERELCDLHRMRMGSDRRRTRIGPNSLVRHKATPDSPRCSVGSTAAHSVIPKGSSVICIECEWGQIGGELELGRILWCAIRRRQTLHDALWARRQPTRLFRKGAL